MHRTLGIILATSRNKMKHISPSHYFTQARGYNTQTNLLILLHTGENDPFPLLHTGKRVFTGFLGTENLTQHSIPTRAFKQFRQKVGQVLKSTCHHSNIYIYIYIYIYINN